MIAWLYKHRNSVATFLIIWPYIVALVLFSTIRYIDGSIWPVVRDFTVTSRGTQEGNLVISGYMVKIRDCRFIAVEAEVLSTDNGKAEYASIKFLDNASGDNYTSPKGSQKWGNWIIYHSPNAVEVKLYARHDCNPLWITRTKLTNIKVHEGVT